MPETTPVPRTRVAVLISGTGTNMAALLYASRAEDCPYTIVLVASNVPDAPGLALAAAEGVPVFAAPHQGLTRPEHEARIEAAVLAAGAEAIALAGYMRVLSADFVTRWAGRMVNIHPSLLPAYPGLHTHARALAAGEAYAGCTVHLVTPELDAGPILGQTRVAVLPGDTPETLGQRVRLAEHQLYPRCLAALVSQATSPAWLTNEVRRLAMALPAAEETLSHSMACFGIGAVASPMRASGGSDIATNKKTAKGKKFAWVSVNHHGDGRVALLVKISGVDEQMARIEADPARYFRPAYFGDGWLGIRLDLGDTDWDAINDWLTRSWAAVAPRRLLGRIDAGLV